MGELRWRGYDRAALDRQINLRARTPEHASYFERWARDSAAARARLAMQCDLAYGDAPGERLDFVPAGGTGDGAGAPLVVFIHGGYWQGLDKGDYSYLATPFVEAGVAFASLNYTLAPAAPIRQMVEEVRRAIVWLHAQAGRLSVDRRRIVVSGHSAGGHLAAMLMVTDWSAHGLPAGALAGACAISGVYDLEPISKSYQQEVLRLDAGTVGDCSPQRLTPAAPPAPLLLAVGAEEPEEFRDQQADFAAHWRGVGGAVDEVPLPGRHHFSAVDALGESGHPLHAMVTRLARTGSTDLS
jgi:arylformamidase